MIENITIVDKNGNSIIAEGLSYINIIESNKKYVFYTLNEIVSDNLTKIYIAEVSDAVGAANPINDTEWDYLRTQMVKISHGENVTEIQNLPMTGLNFNIGEPRKLAVKPAVKQAFRDRQTTQILAVNKNQNMDTPVVSQNNTVFFNADVASQDIESNVNNQTQNIFQTPIQPVEYIHNSLPESTTTNQEANIVSQPTIFPQNVSLDNSNQVVQSVQNSAQLIEENNIMPVENIQTTEVVTDTLIPEKNLTIEEKEKVVTKEEAMQALETLNRYFKYTNELPSSLINSDTNVLENVSLPIQEKVIETNVSEETIKNVDNAYITTDLQSLGGEELIVPSSQSQEVLYDVPAISIDTNVASQTQNTTDQNQDVMQFSQNNALEYNNPIIESNEFLKNEEKMINEPILPPLIEPTNEMYSNVTPSEQENMGYVATGNGAAVQINATIPSAVSTIPVVMPDGYDEAQSINNMNGMGPASLTGDGNPTLGLREVA